MKSRLFIVFLLWSGILLSAQESAYSTKTNIPYYPEAVSSTDEYIAERIKKMNKLKELGINPYPQIVLKNKKSTCNFSFVG